jgi:hypothetical protein
MNAQTWCLGCAALAWLSCATARPPEASPSAPAATPIPRADGTVHVTGVAERIVPWCKGMAPPPGGGSQTHPDGNAAFVVKAGTENSEAEPLMTVHADASGRLDFALPAGRWCLVASSLAPRPPSRTLAEATAPRIAGGDLQCADALWRACAAVIDATGGDVAALRVERFEHCGWNQPCQAPGPAPP